MDEYFFTGMNSNLVENNPQGMNQSATEYVSKAFFTFNFTKTEGADELF